MKRRLFLLSILLALLPGFAGQSVKKYWSQPDLSVLWVPIKILPEGITVVYEVKYGSNYKIDCIGLWQSKKEYLLTFKTKEGYRLQKSNIVSIYYKKKDISNLSGLKHILQLIGSVNKSPTVLGEASCGWWYIFVDTTYITVDNVIITVDRY